MENKIFKILRENKIGHHKAHYIKNELLILFDVSNQRELFCECTESKPLLKDMYDKTTCNTCRKEIKQNCC